MASMKEIITGLIEISIKFGEEVEKQEWLQEFTAFETNLLIDEELVTEKEDCYCINMINLAEI